MVKILKADGITLPNPDLYTLDFEEISKAERNAAGTMVKDVIAYKYKLNLTWAMLTQVELAKLMNIKRKNSFMLEFLSMDTGEKITGHFYAGTPQATSVDFSKGKVEYWRDIKMNFIEM